MSRLSYLAALFMLVFSVPVFGEYKSIDDKELHAISQQMRDSLESSGDAFYGLHDKGARLAEQRSDDYYIYLFAKELLARLNYEHERVRFINEYDRTVESFKQRFQGKSTRFIYEYMEFAAERFSAAEIWDEYISVVEDMSRFADASDDRFGTALSNFMFGNSYLESRDMDKAEEYYDKALEMFESLGEYAYATRVGFKQIVMQINRHEDEKGLAFCDSTYRIIMEREKEGNYMSSVDKTMLSRYRLIFLYRLGRFEQTDVVKDSMLFYNEMYKDPSLQEGIQYTLINLERAKKNYDKALEGYDAMIDSFLVMQRWMKVAKYQYTKADCLEEAGRLEEAIGAYKQYIAYADSATRKQSRERLDELTTRYEVARLREENYMANKRLSLEALAIILLFITLGMVFYSRHRLRQRNIYLYDSIQKQDEVLSAFGAHVQVKPVEQQTAEEVIFSKFYKLMEQDHIYKDPNLTREKAAAMVGTNKTYLSDAIRICTGGLTFSEFLNNYRLHVAANLFEKEPGMSVDDMCLETGFGSRTTLFRRFKESFGMSPTEYVEASRGVRDGSRRKEDED